jgi:putrescine aminotransferase
VAPAGLEYVHFVNSGAEATEAAIKIARTCGHHRLVSMTGGFHGKTMGALSVTSSPLYREPFAPLLPGVTQVPFGDPAALEAVLADDGPSRCVIAEPVLAEGGVVLPPDGFLAAVERLCRRHGAFLVVDEIQTGLGRLGTWWGCDREGVVPDVLLAGKALSGGVVPVAAAIATPRAYAALSRDPFLHTSTFAGSPLATAAAHAALVAIAEEDIVGRAQRLGALLLERIREIPALASPALVRDIRGRGLLIGLEFSSGRWAAEIMLELLARRVIVNHSLNDQRVVRLTPAAVMGDDEVEWLLEALHDSAEAVRSRCEAAIPEVV